MMQRKVSKVGGIDLILVSAWLNNYDVEVANQPPCRGTKDLLMRLSREALLLEKENDSHGDVTYSSSSHQSKSRELRSVRTPLLSLSLINDGWESPLVPMA